jgi:hypothetical protein
VDAAKGVYTFSSADEAAGVSVVISYTYVSGFNGETITGHDLLDHQGDHLQVPPTVNPATALGHLDLPDASSWTQGHNYIAGEQVTDSNGGLQTCTKAGQSGSTAPQWPNPSLVGGNFVTGHLTPDNGTAWRYDGPMPQEAILEVEFEGASVWNLYQALLAALAVATAGAVIQAALCATVILCWLGWLISLALALIAMGISGIGVWNAVSDRSAEQDVNNQVGAIVPGVDVLVVRGTWVWDGGHIPHGWNELHPVVYAQRIASVPNADLLDGQP